MERTVLKAGVSFVSSAGSRSKGSHQNNRLTKKTNRLLILTSFEFGETESKSCPSGGLT
jgi:hypothetical protein